MDTALTHVANTVRGWMRAPAALLNKVSGGRIKPNHVTLISLLGHVSVVWALWQARPVLAALLLAFFGIMDTLDGALARLQKTASLKGMFFDATSDRVKEVLVYIGLIEWANLSLVMNTNLPSWLSSFYSYGVAWVVIAICGMSLVVSYSKAKGEMALSEGSTHSAQDLNKTFADGFARYEIRMVFIIFGLSTGTILYILPLLLALIVFTALQRIIRISKALT